jgi:hypothetical protein
MEWPEDEDLYAGVTLGLGDDELPAEVARQQLATLRGERAVSPLVEAVRVAQAVGLKVAEMERMSGYTRQTIYTALRSLGEQDDRSRPRDRSTVSQHVLVALCALGGEVPVPELAARLRLPREEVAMALQTLRAEQLCEVVWPKPAEGLANMSSSATAAGYRALRRLFNDLFLARPDGFSVYLGIEHDERKKIADAADVVISSHEHTLIAASVAPSRMTGPELALTVHAPTGRVAIAIAADLWSEIRQQAGLPNAVARITELIPPSAPPAADSVVLEAFSDAIINSSLHNANAVTAAKMQYRGGIDERSLAGRCLTAAARALRRSVGQDRDPRPIADGEAAFGELMPVRGLSLDRERAPIQRSLSRALDLAADHLGPFRGGELGSFREPGQPPPIAERVEPTSEQLEEMASLAGQAVGRAASLGYVDPAREVESVIGSTR